MTFNWRLAGISLALLALLAGVGCTNSKVLSPANGGVTFQVVIDPAAGPRDGSKPPFVWAKAEFAAVDFVPVDSSAQITLGPKPFQFLEQALDVDLSQAGPQTLGSVNISPGLYKIDLVFFNWFDLNTSNEPPVASQPACAAGSLEYARFLPEGSGALPIVPANQPVFEVRAGATTTVRLLVSGTALTTLLEAQVTCEEGSNLGAVSQISRSTLGALLTFQLP
ncbi:MAG: hypothetical protein LAO51_19790 [Acidobacteriia bacterium]|nr:hypothetical protein [Terriglobia bacterium]